MYKMLHATKAHLLCTDPLARHLYVIDSLISRLCIYDESIRKSESLVYIVPSDDCDPNALAKALRDCGYDVRVNETQDNRVTLLIQWSKPTIYNTAMEV